MKENSAKSIAVGIAVKIVLLAVLVLAGWLGISAIFVWKKRPLFRPSSGDCSILWNRRKKRYSQ